MPVIHLPDVARVQRGCAGAVAIGGAVLGIVGAVVAVVIVYATSAVTSAVAPPTAPRAVPGVTGTLPVADEPSGPLVEEDYFANANLAKARYEKVLGRPIMAKGLTLMQYYATLEAQDPKHHDHVDSYKLWANKVERPQPVRLGSEKQQLSQILISLDTVDFRVVPQVIKQALSELKLEEGKVSMVMLDRDGQSPKREPIWRVVVNGSRENGVVEFSVSGEKLRQY